MKFRTKLFYSFISLALISSLLSLFIIYGETSRLVFNETKSKVRALVSNAVQLINPNDVEMYIKSNGYKENIEFKRLKQILLKIRNLNRETDTFFQYVYIIHKDKNSDRYFFIMDAEENHQLSFNYGDPFSLNFPLPKNSKKVYVTFSQNIHSHPKGSWITGYAPIFDKEGNTIALLGVDIRIKEIYSLLEKLFFYGLFAFIVSIFVAMFFAYILSNLVSLSLSNLCETVKRLAKGDFSSRSSLSRKDEFNELSLAINHMATGLEEREKLKVGFSRYVSQYALEGLLGQDRPIILEGERKKVTILFSDIREFTSIAEKHPPEMVLKLLNEYFSVMIEVIFNYGGTLDKFIGDGLMVEFGAPLEDELQELHAVLAAIYMQLHLNQLCKKWEKEGKQRISIGIGIHTGFAVLGNIGSERRMEYTAIGDTVNIASRLEWLTKCLHKPIIISQTVYDKVKDHFIFENLDSTKIPGRIGNIQAYAIHPQLQKNLEEIKSSYKKPPFPDK